MKKINSLEISGWIQTLIIAVAIQGCSPLLISRNPQSVAAAASATICDVTEFGAVGDGATKNTAAIQAAIDRCARGGGTVVLHQGVFLSGMISLKSNVTLRIDPGATLKGTQDDADYPDTHPQTDNSQLNNCRKALVYAERATNLTIEGGGTIDGNGNKPEWIGPNTLTPERTRPMAIYLVQSNNVLIQNIHVRDSATWGVVNLETDNLTIRGIDIHSDLFGNRDGIDVVDCHHVLIENNTVFSEDDSICLKSGTARGVEDVMVRNNKVLKSTVANGLKLGTASTGGFKNVTFENNSVQNVAKAVMTVEAIDGAKVENIIFKDITFANSGTPFFVLLGKRKDGSKDGTAHPVPVGSINGVHFENIQGQAMKSNWGSAITGTILAGVRYAPQNITFDHVVITFQGDKNLKARPPDPPEYAGQYPDPNIWGDLPASGIYFRHIDGLKIQNSKFDTSPKDARTTVVEKDVSHGPLAHTSPPLYWTPYEYCFTHDDFIPEAVWQKNVNWVADQLKPLGYDMIVTDGWIYGDTAVNKDGYLERYNNSWSGDWASWSNTLAQKGLKLGIYYNPLWIQASAFAQNNYVRGTSLTIQQIAGIRRSTGKYEKYWIDPNKPGAKEYVQGYVRYFKAMNVKLLRLDFLSEFENDYGTANYDKVLSWIREAAGNDLFISLVMPNAYNLAATEVKYGNMMRVSEDTFQGGWSALSDRYRGQVFPVWPPLRNAFDGFIHFASLSGKNQMILDGDALRLNTFSSDVERKTAVTLYTMAGSPIPVADQVDTIGSSLPFLANPELRQLTQSWFVGKPLHAVLGDFDNQRWVGQTQDGHWIIGLFNRDSVPKPVSINFTKELGTSGPVSIRDLWKHQDLAAQTSYSTTLAPHDSALLKVGE